MAVIPYEEVQSLLVNPPTMEPRPNSTNIKTFKIWFINILEGIPSQQSNKFGHKGLAQQVQEYALHTNVPWIDFPETGNHQQADGAINATQQRDADAIWNAANLVYTNQQNVKRACIRCLNVVVRKKYERTNGI